MAEKLASSQKILQGIDDIVNDESRNQEFAKLMELSQVPAVDDAAKNNENAKKEELVAELKIESGNKTEQIIEPVVVVEKVDIREKESLEILNRARKEFAEMDYKKAGMWKQVNRYFKKSKLDINETRSVEIEKDDGIKEIVEIASDEDVTYMQALYDNALIDYKNIKIENIQRRGLSGGELGDELKNLAIEIGKFERIALIDEKNEIRGREMRGTVMESGKNIFQKSIEWYKGLGMKKQIVIGVGLVAGTSAAAIGAAAGIAGGATLASCFAAATLGRRILGGASTGIAAFGAAEGGAAALRNIKSKIEANDVLKEFSDAEISHVRQYEIKNLSEEQHVEVLARELSEDERFAIIKSRLNNITFKSNDEVDAQKINTLLRATGATFFGALMGSGVLTQWISEKTGLGDKIHLLLEKGKYTQVGQMIMEKLGMENISKVSNLEGAAPPKAPIGGVFDSNNVNPANGGSAPTNFQEALRAPTATETLRIEKGSSIDGTLIKFYKEHGLQFKDNGHAAHIAYLDYMTDYIENNREELIKSGKLAEYQKMLKDGMVNVKPGTEIVIDPHTGNIISIDGKLSHLHGHYSGVEHGNGSPVAAETDSIAEKTNEESPAPSVVSAPPTELVDELTKRVENLENHENVVHGEAVEKIIASQDKIKQLNIDYAEAMDDVFTNKEGDGAWDKLIEKAGSIDKQRTGLVDFLKDVTDSDKNAAETLRSMRQSVVEFDVAKWKSIENMKMKEIIQKENFEKLPRTGKNIINYFNKELKMTFRPSETMNDWTRRVVVSTERMLAASKE